GGQRLQGRRAQDRRRSGAERDGDQGGLPERHDANDDPALVEHRQDADDRDVDGDRAEDEPDLEGVLQWSASSAGAGRHRRDSAHARFLAMRSPMIPYGRKISTMMSKVNAMRSRSW